MGVRARTMSPLPYPLMRVVCTIQYVIMHYFQYLILYNNNNKMIIINTTNNEKLQY